MDHLLHLPYHRGQTPVKQKRCQRDPGVGRLARVTAGELRKEAYRVRKPGDLCTYLRTYSRKSNPSWSELKSPILIVRAWRSMRRMSDVRTSPGPISTKVVTPAVSISRTVSVQRTDV